MMAEKGYSRYDLCTGGNTESKSERVQNLRTKLTGEERHVMDETVTALTDAVDVLSMREEDKDLQIVRYKLQARLEALKRVMDC